MTSVPSCTQLGVGTEPHTDENDLVWGAPSIARIIGKSVRATYHLLENQLIPAGKVGGHMLWDSV